MTLFDTLALILTLCAALSYLNHRFVKLPTTIGLMLGALAISTGLNVLHWFGVGLEVWASGILEQIDFSRALLKGLLSFLLFAGALHVNLNDLAKERAVVFTLATVGVVVSTFLVGTLTYYTVGLFGFELSYIYCLVFGALISPTDPIAVLAILKTVNPPKSLETRIAGESLFNDGVGVVVFTVLLNVAIGDQQANFASIATLFAKEALGGVVLGLVLGYLAYLLIRSVDHYQVEILLTLALVTGGYALAMHLHTSGPLTVVVAGLLIGNHGRNFGMSQRTRNHLDTFWELVDEILNAALFVLIGLEVLVIPFDGASFAFALLAIVICLASRAISILIPVLTLRIQQAFVGVLTWGGLKGGISVALALAIPAGPERQLILTTTYTVVIFSIVVQGLTIKRLLNRVLSLSA